MQSAMAASMAGLAVLLLLVAQIESDPTAQRLKDAFTQCGGSDAFYRKLGTLGVATLCDLWYLTDDELVDAGATLISARKLRVRVRAECASELDAVSTPTEVAEVAPRPSVGQSDADFIDRLLDDDFISDQTDDVVAMMQQEIQSSPPEPSQVIVKSKPAANTFGELKSLLQHMTDSFATLDREMLADDTPGDHSGKPPLEHAEQGAEGEQGGLPQKQRGQFMPPGAYQAPAGTARGPARVNMNADTWSLLIELANMLAASTPRSKMMALTGSATAHVFSTHAEALEAVALSVSMPAAATAADMADLSLGRGRQN